MVSDSLDRITQFLFMSGEFADRSMVDDRGIGPALSRLLFVIGGTPWKDAVVNNNEATIIDVVKTGFSPGSEDFYSSTNPDVINIMPAKPPKATRPNKCSRDRRAKAQAAATVPNSEAMDVDVLVSPSVSGPAGRQTPLTPFPRAIGPTKPTTRSAEFPSFHPAAASGSVAFPSFVPLVLPEDWSDLSYATPPPQEEQGEGEGLC